MLVKGTLGLKWSLGYLTGSEAPQKDRAYGEIYQTQKDSKIIAFYKAVNHFRVEEISRLCR